LRSQFPEDKANELFNNIRSSQSFKDSLNEVFESMKRWFFDEVVPKYKLERGDIFVITATLELNINTGELKWIKEDTQVIYWVRSDRVAEKCKELGLAVGGEELDKLRREKNELLNRVNELEKKVNELEGKVSALTEENNRLRKENEELKRKLEEIKQLLG
ncbi:MAG: transcription factor, partial [Vulcanisaeta sp.]|nr:transcription factor [Vulcanisaeta sp.]